MFFESFTTYGDFTHAKIQSQTFGYFLSTMLSTLFIICADTTRTAKVSFINLPQQSLLEMCIDRIQNKSIFQTKSFPWSTLQFADVCEWVGVTCTSSNQVQSIKWINIKLNGEIDVRFLPGTTETFEAKGNLLTGKITLSELPPSMTEFRVTYNKVYGAINLTMMHEGMTKLNLSHNKLKGTLNLTQLPDGFQLLILSANVFTGTIDLNNIPESVLLIALAENLLHGEVDLRKLPQKTKTLLFASNKFSSIRIGAANEENTLKRRFDFWLNPVKQVYCQPGCAYTQMKERRVLQFEKSVPYVLFDEGGDDKKKILPTEE